METKDNVIEIANLGGYIDYYVDKRIYDSKKTVRGKLGYLKRCLEKELGRYKYDVLDIDDCHISIRDLSSQFDEEPIPINDLDYSSENKLPVYKDKTKLCFRVFKIRGVGLCLSDDDKEKYNSLRLGDYGKLRNENSLLKLTVRKIC